MATRWASPAAARTAMYIGAPTAPINGGRTAALYRLKPDRLQEVDARLVPFRRFWSARVDALERRLDRMDQ